MSENMQINRVKKIGFTAISIMALVMALFMMFSITYPVSAGQESYRSSESFELAKYRINSEDVYSGRARRVGDELQIIFIV